MSESYGRGGVFATGTGLTDADLASLWPPTAVVSAEMTRRNLQAFRDAMPTAQETTPPRPNYCYYCHQPIRIMINRGTGWCSEQCRKKLAEGWEADE